MEEALKAAGEEIEVFEKAEKPEVEDDTPHDDPFPPSGIGTAVEPRADVEVHGGGDEDEGKETPVPAGVEKVAGDQEHRVLLLVGEEVIDAEDEGKKDGKL